MHNLTLTVMGTTDLHGYGLNWNYFTGKEYDDAAGNDVGLAKISTLVTAVRGQRGADHTLLIDAGDILQGTPLAHYYARIDPITAGAIHPMAAAMNAMGYHAAALGNHEFNYGIALLRRFESQVDFPLLGANAVDASSGQPAFPPYALRRVQVCGAKPVNVGILGLTNPGIAIWDKAEVGGRMHFPGIVEQAKVFVPKLRAAGAEIVIVAAHSGAATSSSYGDVLPYPENASTLLAEQVPGIDAILVGHAHVEIAQRYVTNSATGRQVLLTEPLKWGMRLSLIDLDLALVRGRWTVSSVSSQLLDSNSVPEDPAIVGLLTAQHQRVVAYVNGRVGTCTAVMSAATARYECTAALGFVNYVQADAVRAALAGTPTHPVLSIAAPFNRDAAIPQGTVSVRDVAGLYVFDNTLLAITFTGAQLKDYLEWSAAYFRQVTGAGPFAPDDITNAVTPTAPAGTPDNNYDIVAGLDAPVAYDIDISRPVGRRLTNFTYGGAPVADDATFTVAINSYRQSGGGNFPHVIDAPVVYDPHVEIRQLLIDWVSAEGEVDAARFSAVGWRLVADGRPVQITG